MGAGAGLWAMSQGIQAIAGVGNAYMQGKAGIAQAGFQADAMDRNARMAEFQAGDARARGDLAAAAIHRDTRRLMGAQRVAASAGGISSGSGSAAALQAQAASMGALDEATVRMNAMREVWGLKSQASEYRFQGNMAQKMARWQAKMSLLGAGLGGIKGLAQGASSLGGAGEQSEYGLGGEGGMTSVWGSQPLGR